MPYRKDYKIIEKATIYDLRLIFSSGEKETYTKEEIMELLDKIAIAKGQEHVTGAGTSPAPALPVSSFSYSPAPLIPSPFCQKYA